FRCGNTCCRRVSSLRSRGRLPDRTIGMKLIPNDSIKYFRQLFAYVLREKRLMFLSMMFGVVGLCLPFVYPWILGRAIDFVILGHGINGAPAPSFDQRVHALFFLTGAAALTAFAFAIAGYSKGHF